MKIVDTSTTNPSDLSPFEREQVYNGLDCCVTAEVLNSLLPQLDNQTSSTYAFSKALQGPVLEMRLRGMLVDKQAKAEVVETYHQQLDFLDRRLERIVREGFSFYGFNWRSNPHLHRLLYEVMGIPEIKRKGRATVDRDALEKLQLYLMARPIIAHILLMRDIGKKISVLKTEIDNDGRMRTSYNIAGTNTFRFSSSFTEFGTGGNLQNVEELLRRVFVADPGKKLGYFDAEQIQSRIVGAIEWNVVNDGKYLDACESGDLHTYVARLCEPKWEWTGDISRDREIAERPYYRQHSLRKLCKSIGHGTNFAGKPTTLSIMYKIVESVIAQFQGGYFRAFPGHLKWHAWVDREIRAHGTIHSITGNRREFWGRRDDPDTIREAIAFDPQCSEAHIVNNGMLNVWRARDCDLLLHCHDALVVQFPEEREDEVVPKILKQLRCPIELRAGRRLEIPYGSKTGWNWGDWREDNPDGLKEYRPSDQRRRTPQAGILDRRVRTIQ